MAAAAAAMQAPWVAALVVFVPRLAQGGACGLADIMVRRCKLDPGSKATFFQPLNLRE